MPPINQKKIDSFLAVWNTGRPENNPLWKEVPGLFAPIGMTINQDNSVAFNGNFGFPTKIFMNTETQELKMFDARRFT